METENESSFTKADRAWILYGLKIGLVMGACLGCAIGFTFGAYTFMPGVLTRSMGYVISGILAGLAFFLAIGYMAVVRGVTMGSLRDMEISVEED